MLARKKNKEFDYVLAKEKYISGEDSGLHIPSDLQKKPFSFVNNKENRIDYQHKKSIFFQMVPN